MASVSVPETASSPTAVRASRVLPASQRPSLHVFLLLALVAFAAVAHVCVMSAGAIRGYSPSLIVAARNLGFYVPLVGAFLWLARSQKYRGTMVLFTSAMVLSRNAFSTRPIASSRRR